MSTPDSAFIPATLPDSLAAAARRRGGEAAYIDGERVFSFADLDAAAQRVAAGLLSIGLTRGDRIGVVALNQIEWLMLFFGATRIGVAVVGMSVRYRDNELEYMVEDSRVKAVFTISGHEEFDFFAMWERLIPKLPTLERVVGIDESSPQGGPTLFDLMHHQPDPGHVESLHAQVAPDDLAMIIYTSGTTGRPKGAGLTHRSMLASARAQASHLKLDEHDTIQLATPLNHVGGITCGVLSMMVGGGLIDLVGEFKAPVVLDRMQMYPPTLSGGVPTMMTLLLMHAQGREIDWGQIRALFVGGSNVDATLLAQLHERMPNAAMMNLYGLSESSGAIVMTPWGCDGDDLTGSIGKPLEGAQLKVIDKQGDPVPAGEVGELCFRGAGVIPGYVGAAASNDAFSADGWLRTGDLGKVDSRGFITLMGRAKDMYIQGGFNVYPAEIEAFIAQHPGVLMVAGIGIPDPMLGEVGRYYVTPKPGSGLTADELRVYCREHLADYKVPRQFVLRDSLPLTPAGKIHKAALRQEG